MNPYLKIATVASGVVFLLWLVAFKISDRLYLKAIAEGTNPDAFNLADLIVIASAVLLGCVWTWVIVKGHPKA